MIKITHKSAKETHEYMQGFDDTGSDLAVTPMPEYDNAVGFSVYDTQQDSDASVTLDKETALALARYIIDSVG